MAKTKKMTSPFPDTFKGNWGWLIALGTLLLVMGCIGLGMEIKLTLVSMYFFAAILIVSAVSHFVHAFQFKKWEGAVWQILISILYLVASVVFIHDPFLASVLITAVLAWILIILGITRIIMVISLKESKGWGWLLFAGITSIILGVLILIQWPMSGLWVIGMFISIEMIVSGWTYIFIAMALRSLV